MTTKEVLWKCIDNMTQELEDLYRERSKKKSKDGFVGDYTRTFPRPMTERMNLIRTLLDIQTVFEHEKSKQRGRYVDPE